MGLDPGSPGSHPGLKVMPNHWTPGLPHTPVSLLQNHSIIMPYWCWDSDLDTEAAHAHFCDGSGPGMVACPLAHSHQWPCLQCRENETVCAWPDREGGRAPGPGGLASALLLGGGSLRDAACQEPVPRTNPSTCAAGQALGLRAAYSMEGRPKQCSQSRSRSTWAEGRAIS